MFLDIPVPIPSHYRAIITTGKSHSQFYYLFPFPATDAAKSFIMKCTRERATHFRIWDIKGGGMEGVKPLL